MIYPQLTIKFLELVSEDPNLEALYNLVVSPIASPQRQRNGQRKVVWLIFLKGDIILSL